MTEAANFEVLPPASGDTADGPPPVLTAEQLAILKRVENLARMLDSAVKIPGLNFRVGADGIAGFFLPVVGDVLAAVASGYIVVQANKLGLPGNKLMKMVTNILVDTTVGAVPLAGDLLDIAVKANLKNADIIRDHFQLPPMDRDWNPTN